MRLRARVPIWLPSTIIWPGVTQNGCPLFIISWNWKLAVLQNNMHDAERKKAYAAIFYMLPIMNLALIIYATT